MPYLHPQQDPTMDYFARESGCHCTNMRTSGNRSFGEAPLPENEIIASAINDIFKSGRKPSIHDVNQVSDQVFFARYPTRNGKLIDPKTEPGLAEEWKIIRSRMVLPILKAIDFNNKGKDALRANQFMLAVSFFDRARRVSISPAQQRAAATFNLGQGSRGLKRFAAAIGYFEIVRTFSGISEEIRGKAEKNLALAKEEYHKAVL